MNSNLTVNLLRALFIVAATCMGAFAGEALLQSAIYGAIAGTLFGSIMVLVDRLLCGVSLRVFSSASVGLALGFLVSYLFQASGILKYQSESIQYTASLILYAVFGYIGMMLAMRSSRDEFSIIIPYVRFSRQSVYDLPVILDTNILIDGRLKRVVETGFLSSSFIVPEVVLNELQSMADSTDWQTRNKGKRGLDNLAELRGTQGLEITVHETSPDLKGPVDQRLIQIATVLQARLLTNDTPLCKVARLRGVVALNLNELAGSLEHHVHAGDSVEIPLIKPGRESHQAVGYLPSGNMVVVNNASHLIGSAVSVSISSAVATGAGQLFFAELAQDTRVDSAGAA